MRRAALKDGNRAVGFPTIVFPCEMASNLDVETMIGAMYVAKYGGIVVFSDFKSESLFPLLLERLNIYTDPQRPMTVTEGIYEIGNPDENSPVMVTTNFALTYFIVSGEIEGSRVPSWLLIKDAEGLSVMTAWAAGKFSGDDVGMFIKKSGIADKVKHQEVIIPGLCRCDCRRRGGGASRLDHHRGPARSGPHLRVSQEKMTTACRLKYGRLPFFNRRPDNIIDKPDRRESQCC